jgi:hypothetical protein
VPLIAPIDIGSFNLQPEPAYFTQTFAPELAELNSLSEGMLAIESAPGTIDVKQVEAYLNAPLIGMEGVFAQEGADPTTPYVTSIFAQSSKVDAAIAKASASLNAAAALAPPGAFKPPVVRGGSNPIGEPGLGPPPPPPPIPAPVGTVPGYGGSSTLSNTSRADITGFVPGDHFRLVISGIPGETVTVKSSKNGIPLSDSTVGKITASGLLVITGVMGQGDVGNWREQWYVAGFPAGAPITFTVRG